MKRTSKVTKPAVLLFLLTLFAIAEVAQESAEKQGYKRFPIIAGLQFQNFSMPFRDVSSHFTHPGLFIGSEIGYNKKGTLFQNATIGGYLNREIGDGLYFTTQLCFRPRIVKKFYGELRTGVGYQRVFHPTPTYEYQGGNWQEITGGKSQLTFPLDVGFGYSFTTGIGELSPTITYQINPALFYNATLPFNIYNSFLLSLRLNLPN